MEQYGANGSAISSWVPANHASDARTTQSEAEAAASNESWTVLFYLCGSNLESEDGLATYNLQELSQAKLGDNVRFVIEAGGAKKWQNRAFKANRLTRAVYDSAGFAVVDELPSASMATADTLRDFVSWGTKNYPADHYLLVFWDHGAGSVFGVCNDELYPGNASLMGDTLTTAEIDQALKDCGVTFDAIGFDTCLMATVETAAKLAPYADYMVASEETEPGYGWDYVAWPEWLGGHTGTAGDLLGRKICDSYYDKCRKFGVASMATLSVVDLSHMGTLAQAFYRASEEMAQATTNRASLRQLYRGAFDTERYGGDAAYNMVDLSDLMNNTRSVVTEHYDDVVAAVNEVVVYQVHGRSRPKASGLSVFYPLDTSNVEMLYGYLDIVGNVPYAQFLSVMYGKYNQIDWSSYDAAVPVAQQPVESGDVNIQFDEHVNGDGKLELQITQGVDDVALVGIQMGLYLADARAVVYLGTDYDLSNPQAGTYVDDFNGEWMAIDGNYVCANLLEHGNGYNLYSVPVKLNDRYTNLIASYDYASRSYEILCACDEAGPDVMSSKSLRALQDGDQIVFVFGAHSFDTNETFTFEMGQTTYSSETRMANQDMGAGSYLFRFTITDVLGQTADTAYFVQDYAEDGSITARPF